MPIEGLSMKRIATPIETNELCSYGCGNVAKFINGSKKLMCKSTSNSCPTIRSKNSSGVAKAHADGKIPIEQLNGNRGWSRGLTKETDLRIAKNSEIRKGRPGISRPHTDSARRKIAMARTEWLKNPENRKNYGRGKKSWMELCFEKWLNENDITGWEFDKHFWNPVANKNYFADFCFDNLSLIVELDGNQHLKTIEQDRIRDVYLTSLGYRVIRITHKEFKERFFSNTGFFDILK